MTELLPNIFAIEVPVRAKNIDIADYVQGEPPELMYDCANMVDMVPLPPGNYSFICASLTATEEEAAKIVEPVYYPMTSDIMGYVDYGLMGVFGDCDTAAESLQTLLSSKRLNPELNYAILRKQF